MKSRAKTADRYIAELPAERREAIGSVRTTILANLPRGYVETMDWGMISYQIPLETYPETYNGKPLMYAALASQKGYMAVYLSAIYMDAKERARFERRYRKSGKRYDVGQSCVRFRSLDDLPLDVIGDAIASTSVETYIARYERAREESRTAPPRKRRPARRGAKRARVKRSAKTSGAAKASRTVKT